MNEIDYSNLTKAQRRKQEKERLRAEKKEKKRIRKIRNYGVIFLVVLAIAGFFYWRLTPAKNGPIIEISPSKYDFGIVNQANGKVSGLVTITNIGNRDLVLKNMDTSCGCTSASVVYKGIEGPKFSMAGHGTNPKDWEQVILPGESTQLKIYYDPNVHKDLQGYVTRSVSIYSNAAKKRKMEVIIEAFQTS